MFIVLPLPEEKRKIYGYQMIRVKYMQDIQIFLLDNNNEGILCVFPIERWLNALNACAAAVYSSHLQMKWGCKNLGKDSWTESYTSVYRPSLAHNMLLETMT